MNKQELRAMRFGILLDLVLRGDNIPLTDTNGYNLDEWLNSLESLDTAYALSKQRPSIYALVSQLGQLERALLSVADTPTAQLGVLDTITAAIVKYQEETLRMDATIAEFAAMDVKDFVSSEDDDGQA